MMHNTIIDIRGITKVFKVKTQDVQVLKKISLEIKEGDFSIIFGPSGCGKSTLLHIILGLEPPTTGSVHFFDFNFYSYPEDERSEFRKNHIGMVYQQPNWVKSLTVIENVAFAASLLGLEKARSLEKAREVLKMVKMTDWADYLPTELSSGQQQKVSLARALVTDPKVIIADEPTGNLDYQSGIELMTLFKNLQVQGKTVIMVTHNVDNVDFATSVIKMFDGDVVKVIDMKKEKLTLVKKSLVETNSLKNSTFPKTEKRVNAQISFPSVKNLGKQLSITSGLNIKSLKKGVAIFSANVGQTFNFVGLLTVYLLGKLFSHLGKLSFVPSFVTKKLTPKLERVYDGLFKFFQKKRDKTINQVDLIDISIKNMFAKKSRTFITVGGMALGIGAIVFLVSIGYGLEKLVISRVARLDEMRQIDAIPAVASNVKITDKSLASFKDIKSVAKILPIIGVVGKINYQNSNTDVAVYGVMSDYLKESAIKPVQGSIFTSNELVNKVGKSKEGGVSGEVAGAETEKGDYLAKRDPVDFSIEPNQFLRVRKEPNITSSIIGYTRRVEGVQSGFEYWGGEYVSDDGVGEAGTDKDGEKLGLWIRSKVALWEQKDCGQEKDCEQNKYTPLRDEDGHQIFEEGYFAEVNLRLNKQAIARDGVVLGITTDGDKDLSTESASLGDLSAVEIASLSGTMKTDETKTVDLPAASKREAVVNKAFLSVLGIKENQSIGKKFSVSFVATEGLADEGKKVISSAVEYTIIGVTPDAKTPIVYVPIVDIKEMGLNNYSQVKLVVSNQKDLPQARKQIEVLGFKTTSVVDTVSQIEGLFKTLRLILGLLGVVALSVAALGMFNTLTISLLERTREIGMMKAIGMKSVEVQDLFLTESMIMGFFGGVGGLILGVVAGQLLSLILSVLAVFKGIGFVDVSSVPIPFVVLIAFLSLFVGVATGIYPAHRATKISALDALRYE